MEEPKPARRYHIPNVDFDSGYQGDGEFFYTVSDEQLEKWAEDPNCVEMESCVVALSERRTRREREKADVIAKRERNEADLAAKLAGKRKELSDNPFDPRTEVSADAMHIASQIVKHLWIIFVFLPFVIGLLWVIVVVNK